MTNSLLKIICVGFLCLLFSLNAIAQDSDARLWVGTKLEHKINKKWRASVELEQRFDNNLMDFDRLLLEPSLSYKLNKHWGLEASYRIWSRQTLEKNFDYRQRGNVSVSFSAKKKSISLKLVSGVQYGFPDLMQDYSDYSANLVSRNSIRVRYNIFGSRFAPSLKYELFTRIQNNGLMNYQWRTTAATSYYINENFGFRFFYAFEKEHNLDVPFNSHIYGIGASYRL